MDFKAAAVMRLLDRCDAWRRPERFAQMLLACECDARGRLGLEDRPYPQRQRLNAALAAALAADAQATSAQATAEGLSGPAIGQQVRALREAAVGQALAAMPPGA